MQYFFAPPEGVALATPMVVAGGGRGGAAYRSGCPSPTLPKKWYSNIPGLGDSQPGPWKVVSWGSVLAESFFLPDTDSCLCASK